MNQKILYASDSYQEIDQYLCDNNIKRVLLVCDSAISFLRIDKYFKEITARLDIEIIRFDEFQPNPLYDSVEKGVKLFIESKCDCIIAVGGGSSMDVAKCIKLYSNMNHTENYLKQTIIPNNIPFLAVPTTAGTGSEATRYAVIYYEGEKQSVTDYSCIPSIVIFDASVLKTLPVYQKKSTMLDALCHSIESFWSVNSTLESKEYSTKAIRLIFQNMDLYLQNEDSGNKLMLEAANLAGKAINITQTTAGHAMCYKLTSLYKIAHGHAAALCVEKLWPFMNSHLDYCIDSRGGEYLKNVFEAISNAMGCSSVESGIKKFEQLLIDLEMKVPQVTDITEFDLLSKSVNPVRLKNNPVELSEKNINDLYHQILRK